MRIGDKSIQIALWSTQSLKFIYIYKSITLSLNDFFNCSFYWRILALQCCV